MGDQTLLGILEWKITAGIRFLAVSRRRQPNDERYAARQELRASSVDNPWRGSVKCHVRQGKEREESNVKEEKYTFIVNVWRR